MEHMFLDYYCYDSTVVISWRLLALNGQSKWQYSMLSHFVHFIQHGDIHELIF